MALIPAACESCGAIWGAENLIGGTGAANVQITGSRVGPCPKCGGWGHIPDGVYGIQDDALKVVSSGAVPADHLQGLIDLLESLRDGEATPEDVIDKVEADAPELAPVIRNVLAKTDPKFWVSILIMILLWYLPSPKASSGPTAEEIATELRADNAPSLVQSQSNSGRPSQGATRPKRPPKTHGKSKQSKSRKRRK